MDLRERPREDTLRHPWETSRFRFFHRLFLDTATDPQRARVLDVGSGDGWFACELARRCPGARIACWDLGYDAALAAELSATAPDTVTFHAELPAGRYDWLLLLDVLEHVEDDAAFLDRLVDERLEAGGHALVSVPAWPWLYAHHDRELGHFRRYTPSELHALLRGSGLSLLRSGGLFHSLIPLRLPDRLAERLRGPLASRGPSHLWPWGPASARVAEGLLAIDNALSRASARLRLEVPGLSCWAVCEKLA